MRARVLAKLADAEAATRGLQAQVIALTQQAAASAATASVLGEDLASLDRTLSLHSPEVDASAIGPVRAWKDRYGKRGQLRRHIMEVLRGRSPAWTTTAEVAVAVHTACGLAPLEGAASKRFRRNSIGTALRRLADGGYVERGHRLIAPSQGGCWRVPATRPKSLADLQP